MDHNLGLTASQRREMQDDLDLDPLRDVGSVTAEDDSDGSQYTFQHKTIARFRLGRFEFKEHMLSIRSEKDYQEFINILKQVPFQERMGIVELNQQALRNLESDPLTARGRSRVITGMADSAGTDPKHRTDQLGNRQGAHRDIGAQQSGKLDSAGNLVEEAAGYQEQRELSREEIDERAKQQADASRGVGEVLSHQPENRLTELNKIENEGGDKGTEAPKNPLGNLLKK